MSEELFVLLFFPVSILAAVGIFFITAVFKSFKDADKMKKESEKS